ncbi:MAG: DsbA family protein [Pseudomonadota bacterium]
MTLQADLYFSYRSPYSYFGAVLYRRMAEEWDLRIDLRVVFPIAIRDPGFFERENPLWLGYLLKDVMRTGAYLDLPVAMPDPDPIVMDLKTRAIAAEQPLIRPISYLGVEAQRRGAGLAFAAEVASMVWGGVKGWTAPDKLGAAAGRAGLDLAEMEAAAKADPGGCEAEIEANQRALEAAGHWGVPTLVFEGEPFFGQDRADMAHWRMKGRGLTKRT